MDIEATKYVILFTLGVFGSAVLAILAAVLVVSAAYLVFKYGKRMIFDQSMEVYGFYLRKTPWKGYHRFRSRKWNIEHMPL